jgi:hypothetical protein
VVLDIAYEESGTADDVLVILLHGFAAPPTGELRAVCPYDELRLGPTRSGTRQELGN